jgi:hypothetical protein
MGILKSGLRTPKLPGLARLPSGSFSLHRGGGIAASTLPSTFSPGLILEIGTVVIEAFRRASEAGLPLAELNLHYSGLTIAARELRGGALVFLQPATLQLPQTHQPPAMHYKNLDEFIIHLENYIECWKQFNHYLNLARDRKFSRDDETQFLEVKSLIMQGLEAILASVEKGGPKKEEVQQLFQNAPSLRHLAELPEAAASVESQWHRIYIGLQSLLGQLKVQQNKADKPAGWSLFGKR